LLAQSDIVIDLPMTKGDRALQQNTATDGPDLGAKRTRMPLFSAFFMIYIFVSGGSFGIEEMVSSSGPGLTLPIIALFTHCLGAANGTHRQRTGLCYPREWRFLRAGRDEASANFGGFKLRGGGPSLSWSTRRYTSS
jgi:hypothetical protein